jgi:ankyrin repeat protein
VPGSPAAESFFEAARKGDLGRLTSLLDADGSLLNARNSLGQSALILAKYHRQQVAADWLLARNPDLTLFEACAAGVADAVRKLVASQGSRIIDAHAPDGFTPLALACFFGHPEIAGFLVNQGANVNLAATNPMRVAPLHAAVAARQPAIVRMLVSAGADVNRPQQHGWRPLHAAAQNGDEESVKVLLEHGADRQARAENNQTAMDLAMLKGHAGVVALLEA